MHRQVANASDKTDFMEVSFEFKEQVFRKQDRVRCRLIRHREFEA